ncbi:MAG: ATP-binding protein, partial [Myxococcales bacterium]
MDLALFRHLLAQPESERLEFKEWKRKGDLDALCRYCCALANEGGGHFILGVTDRRPRKIVGTTVFAALDETAAQVRAKLGIEVRADQLRVDFKRVV